MLTDLWPLRHDLGVRSAQGGGFTAQEQQRRGRVRLEAAERFERGDGNRVIAADLRGTVRSVERWHHTWCQGGSAALEPKGQQSLPRLSERHIFFDGPPTKSADRFAFGGCCRAGRQPECRVGWAPGSTVPGVVMARRDDRIRWSTGGSAGCASLDCASDHICPGPSGSEAE
ncbi:helix-turn-helix domain-containing protein [Streptomyces sp. NPDC088254]|uniref:helix-turn-helix domain-containing protein n=1 Tax=Streptomyces sp. NPDC088254 TaxID=3365847 RepID=UPI0037F77907